jgi:hypothetical protein
MGAVMNAIKSYGKKRSSEGSGNGKQTVRFVGTAAKERRRNGSMYAVIAMLMYVGKPVQKHRHERQPSAKIQRYPNNRLLHNRLLLEMAAFCTLWVLCRQLF